MKIQVIRKDGDREVITLTEPLTIIRGDRLNRICTSTGAEHWFDQEGKYDGWGMAFSGSVPVDAEAMIKAFEDGREIIPRDDAPEEK